MAHVYFWARGIYKDLKEFERDLSSVILPFSYKNPKTGEICKAENGGIVRTGVRPIQLYECIVPEEQVNELLGIIMPQGQVPYSVLPGQDKKRKKEHGKVLQITNMMRRFLGLEKLPDKWETAKTFWRFTVNVNNIGIHPIGIKKDRRDADGFEQL